jgi:hypothetical protein
MPHLIIGLAFISSQQNNPSFLSTSAGARGFATDQVMFAGNRQWPQVWEQTSDSGNFSRSCELTESPTTAVPLYHDTFSSPEIWLTGYDHLVFKSTLQDYEKTSNISLAKHSVRYDKLQISLPNQISPPNCCQVTFTTIAWASGLYVVMILQELCPF